MGEDEVGGGGKRGAEEGREGGTTVMEAKTGQIEVGRPKLRTEKGRGEDKKRLRIINI